MIQTTGIPDNIAQKLYWVEDNKRTNPLSHLPGGVALVIVFTNGRVFGYDKIKRPSRYISTAVSREIGKPIENIYMSTYIDSVFVKTDEKLPFIQVWRKEDVESLAVVLQKYDVNYDIYMEDMDESITDQDAQDWGYDNLDDFWDSNDPD